DILIVYIRLCSFPSVCMSTVLHSRVHPRNANSEICPASHALLSFPFGPPQLLAIAVDSAGQKCNTSATPCSHFACCSGVKVIADMLCLLCSEVCYVKVKYSIPSSLVNFFWW